MNQKTFETVRHQLSIGGFSIREARYDETAFGSWYVDIGGPLRRKRLIWEGKDGRFVVQAATILGAWRDLWIGQPHEGLDIALKRLTEKSETR